MRLSDAHAEEFIPTRRSLLTRLKQWDDAGSWRDFFDTYWRLIYAVARKSGLDDSEAQEVVQETVISVAGKMRDFKYNPAIGSFKSWLLLITRRRIVDQFRKRPRELSVPAESPDPTTRTAAVARIPDPASLNLDAVWDVEWRKNLLGAALERVKRRVKPRQYQIYELCVLKEWPMDRIRGTLGVNANQVYLAKFRVNHLLKEEVQNLRAETRLGSTRTRGRRAPCV